MKVCWMREKWWSWTCWSCWTVAAVAGKRGMLDEGLLDASLSRVKTIGQKNTKHPSELDGWISDGEVQSKFLDCWKMRTLVTHKVLKLSFFRNEGFEFQNWIKRQGLQKFVEMADPWYPDLVKVFYCNLKISDGTLCSRVKGIDIKLTKEVWTNIAGDDVLEIKEHLNLNTPDEDDNEDESGEEGSTPDDSTRMNVDESEEEEIVEEKSAFLQRKGKSSKKQEVTVVIIYLWILEEQVNCTYKG
ncbi:hypothetical protein LR48_Vigan04g089100 [Vigna angularis]|uniref:DUF4283 domain-containing protein n=1 Tax=Phaseolus angularis TaxID=3914 RepID=A0A0L9UD52_PHAAN|nr:hypothetical protein LR48_Vigan04g089100 [Vigna angularis]